MLQRLLADETGAPAIEYALIAMLIAVACISAFATLGNELFTSFDTISTTVGQTTGGGTAAPSTVSDG